MSTVLATTGLSIEAIAQPGQQSADRSFNIPAQPLGDALTDFGQQSGLQVSVDAATIRGLNSPGVRDILPAAQALSQLLSGTGLTFRIKGNLVVLERAPKTSNAINLGPVQVPGSADTSSPAAKAAATVTEGSGSYTTRAMSVAMKLPMSIRETPQSVTVITAQQIEDRRIETVADIVEQTTGLSINRYESNRGSMFSRGFKIENYLIDNVWTSIDEQWSAGEVLNNTAIFDHAEILRGSDGLMIGTGNPSAVINMVRKRADSRALAANLAVEAGSWSHFGGTADISTPLTASGTTRVRLVADYDRSDSYVDRLENRSYVLFGTMEQDVGDRTLLSAGISYQDNRTDSPSWGGVPAWTLGADDAIVRLDLPRSTSSAANWSYWNTDYTNAFGRIEHAISDSWHAKAAYTRGIRHSASALNLFYPYPIDPDTGKSVMSMFGFKFPVAGYAGRYWVRNVKNDVNLQLDGEVRALGGTHQMIFGYDWSSEHFIADGAPGTVTIDTTPSIFGFDGQAAEPTYIARQNYKDHEITQSAFFGAARIAVAKPLRLIVGTRIIDYKVGDNKTATNSYKTSGRVVPYVGMVLNLTNAISVYASYTSIFQPQNYRNADNRLLAPIEGNTYEAGLKGEFLDGRLNTALSVFRMEQSNVAQYSGRVPEDPANPTGPQRSAYDAVDGVVSKGFEAEVSGEVLPDWQVKAGYSQFKAKQANGDDVNTLIPRRQFDVSTSYKLPGALEALTIGGGVRWQSKTYAHQAVAAALGVPDLEQKSYFVADLMARYSFTDRLSLQINVQNLFDKRYFAPTEDGMQLYWQTPRNAQLRLKYRL